MDMHIASGVCTVGNVLHANAYCFSLSVFRWWLSRRGTWSAASTMNRSREYGGDCIRLETLLCWNPHSIAVTCSFECETIWFEMLWTKQGTRGRSIPVKSLLFYSPYPLLSYVLIAREPMQTISLSATSIAPSCNATSWHDWTLIC